VVTGIFTSIPDNVIIINAFRFNFTKMTKKSENCPKCGKDEGVPLVWGKPGRDAVEKIERKELVCGGCDIWSALGGVVMNRECLSCGHQWNVRE
jgi:hypothetical protein